MGLLFTQVSSYYLRISGNFSRGTISDFTPEIEHHDSVRNIHDHAHIMFNQHY